MLKKTIFLLLILFVCSGCTIVRDDEEEAQEQKGIEIYFVDGKFNPDTYVDDIWEKKVIPTIREQAVDLRTILDEYIHDQKAAGQKYGHREKEEGSPWNFIAKSEGQVIAVKTESRAGTIEVDIPPYDGASDVVVQIGPIMRGESLRDALDFITFGMFTNQLEFGQLAKAFNARARQEALGNIDPASLLGKTIEFYGTFTQKTEVNDIQITPVQLNVVH
ncbi:MAG: DUF2291 domain-containing protein [Candidatus Vecturithrix sp.]|jgi:predicted lipoprotein|nr:DUF2291 domain-containing protein [Candidatus Vecturithrix sp.]